MGQSQEFSGVHGDTGDFVEGGVASDGFGDAVESHGTHALLDGGDSNFRSSGSLSDQFLNLICDRQ